MCVLFHAATYGTKSMTFVTLDTSIPTFHFSCLERKASQSIEPSIKAGRSKQCGRYAKGPPAESDCKASGGTKV